jgi:hypothetical protein
MWKCEPKNGQRRGLDISPALRTALRCQALPPFCGYCRLPTCKCPRTILGSLQLQLFPDPTRLIHFTVALISALSGGQNRIKIYLEPDKALFQGRTGTQLEDPSDGLAKQLLWAIAHAQGRWPLEFGYYEPHHCCHPFPGHVSLQDFLKRLW